LSAAVRDGAPVAGGCMAKGAQRFGSPLELIGNTPIVPIRRLPIPGTDRPVGEKAAVEVWAKIEGFNPGGSIKDRIALSMIEDAEKRGALTKDKIILEATSGNTGIGLALVAAVKGYRIQLTMSEGVSVERRKILAAYGAEFILTEAKMGTDGAIERAYDLADKEPDRYFLTDQYNNPANPLAHYDGTAPEIWEQTGGRLTHFVAALGTTGTVIGCSRRLKEYSPAIQVHAVEPYLGHKIQGLKSLKEAYVPGIFDKKLVDEKVNVADEDAFETSRRAAKAEGLLVGMSAGAALFHALQLAGRLEQGVIVLILPDFGERYLSTSLFGV
jgi:cysteinyl-tRNA synthetase